jgi:hypothetical protein
VEHVNSQGLEDRTTLQHHGACEESSSMYCRTSSMEGKVLVGVFFASGVMNKSFPVEPVLNSTGSLVCFSLKFSWTWCRIVLAPNQTG